MKINKKWGIRNKKHIRKLIMGILVLAFLSNITYADNTVFTDVKVDWQKESVLWGLQEELVDGYEDGTFKPDKQVTESEFAKLMAYYVKLTDNADMQKHRKVGEHWSQHIYDILDDYEIPLGGYNSDVIKDTGLSRGLLARIVAAKNGFNLDEKQAIYYLYENNLSNGNITGRLDFESYEKDRAVKRAEAVAFLQRLDEKGITTFKGKPSDVKGRDIAGINEVPKDTTIITDEDFKKLAEDKGVTPGEGETATSKYSWVNPVADKYKLKIDAVDTDFNLKDKKNNNTILSYDQDSVGFNITIHDYKENKDLLIDVLKATGRFTDKGIKDVINIIEVEHIRDKVPQLYGFDELGKCGGLEPSGNYDNLYLQFGFSE